MIKNIKPQLFSSTSDTIDNLHKVGIPAFTSFEVFPRFTEVSAGTTSSVKVNFDAMFSGTNQWNKEKTYAKDVYVTIYNAEQPLESKIYKTLISVDSGIEIDNTEYWKDETSTFFTISDDNAYHNYIQKIPKCYTHALCIKSTFDPAHQNVIINWGDGLSVALSDAIELNDAIHQDKLTAESDQYLSAVLGKHADGSFDIIYEKPKIKSGNAFGKNECYTYYCYHDYMSAMVNDGIVVLTVNGETVTAAQGLPDQPYRILIYGTTFYGLGRDGGVTLKYYIDPVKDYDITTNKFKSEGDRSTKSKFSHVLLSRIFDPDLPFFPHANITLASLANRAKNLLYINIPKYFDAFNNVINTYEMFERCSNLQYCNGFSNKLRFNSIRGMCRMFNCCENLLKCDIKLAKYVVDHNIDSVHDGNKEVFSFCSKLAVDVMSLLPSNGFSAKYMNITGAFSRCRSLDIADKYIDKFRQILYKDNNKIWKTHADYTADNEDIAGNLEKGTIQIKDSPVFYECEQLIQKKITSDNSNSIIPDGWKNLLPYIDPDIIYITIPTLTDSVYDGSEHSVTVPTHAGYTIVEGSTLFATNADKYKVILKLNKGYLWSDGSSKNQEIEWEITQATNTWTTKPSISKPSWYENEDPGILTEGVAKFGEVKVTLDGEEYDIDNPLPTDIDTYTIKFVVDGNDNYTGLSETIIFSILEVEEPLTFDDIILDSEYGEVKTGLGENQDEVAVIFKNSDVDNIQWTVPGTIRSAEFLAVGGGGGGGGSAAFDKTLDYINRGGAGGGGGGVVTGYINVLPKDSVLSIKVGAGGGGGPKVVALSATSGAAIMGDSTIIYVNDTFYLSAYGGGGDTGRSTNGGGGGSNAGSRLSSVNKDLSWKNTAINENVITNGKKYGNLGGAAPKTTDSARAGGGGGGATEAGGNSNGNTSIITNNDDNNAKTYGGKGGEGLSSDITGTMTVYGSGGGGGSGYRGHGNIGGTGAGKGGDAFNSNDTNEDDRIGGNALPNQGGGGGGAGNNHNGGNGGSGIFVLRFNVNKKVNFPEITTTSFEFDNEEHAIDIPQNEGYNIDGQTSATDVGNYKVILKLNERYVWSDKSTNDKEINWEITQAANEQTTEH